MDRFIRLNLIIGAAFIIASCASMKEQADAKLIVSTKTPPKVIEISIKDNGTGMCEEVKQKIFEPFYTTKPSGSGTGLGLSLSFNIIKAHGGKIEVESTEGKGTEFIITLPA